MSLPETSRTDAHARPSKPFSAAWTWKHQIGWLFGAVVLLAVVIQFRAVEGDRTAKAESPNQRAANGLSRPCTMF